MLGLVLVIDLTGAQQLDPVGVAWGLGAGLAVYFVLAASADDPLPPLVMAWGGMCVGALALVALALAGVLPVRAPRTDVQLLGHSTSWLVAVLGLSLVAAVVAGISAARLLGATVRPSSA